MFDYISDAAFWHLIPPCCDGIPLQVISQLPLAGAAPALRAAGKNSGDLAIEALRTQRRTADHGHGESQQIDVAAVANNAVIRDRDYREVLRIGERLQVFVRAGHQAVEILTVPPLDDGTALD
jgi:hypothetical protein